MFYSTIGQREIHSADGRDYILHSGEAAWTIVWRDVSLPAVRTRTLARHLIRKMKRSHRKGLAS